MIGKLMFCLKQQETVDGPFWQPVDPFTCLIASPKKKNKFHGIKSFIAYTLTPTVSYVFVLVIFP